MRFVVLGDLHFALYAEKNIGNLRDEFFNRLFQSVLAQKPDAVFAIGDVTDKGLAEEFEGLNEIARRNSLNMIIVNGNHDLINLTKAEIRPYTNNPTNYFSYDYLPENKLALRTPAIAPAVLLENNARFIVMDTPKEKEPSEYGGYVDSQQLDWLAGEIKTSAAQPVFAFGHHPLRWATRWSALPKLHIENSRQVRQAFDQKTEGLGFYFCGHNHTNSIHRQKNWTYIQTAAPLRTADFRIIDWSAESFELRTIGVMGGPESLKIAYKLAASIDDFNRVPAKGLSRDRTLSLRLNPNRVRQEATV